MKVSVLIMMFLMTACGLEEFPNTPPPQAEASKKEEAVGKAGGAGRIVRYTNPSDTNTLRSEEETPLSGKEVVNSSISNKENQKDAKSSPLKIAVNDTTPTTPTTLTTTPVVVVPTPAAFNITGPTAVSQSTTVTVSWGASANANTYDLVVSNNANCSNGTSYVGLTTTSKQIAKAEGSYYACVSAKNGTNSTTATNNRFLFTINVEYGLVANAPSPIGWVSLNSVSLKTQIVNWETLKLNAISWTVNHGSSTTYDVYVFTDKILEVQENQVVFHNRNNLTDYATKGWNAVRSGLESGSNTSLVPYY